MITINGWMLDDAGWWIAPTGARLRPISGGGPSGKSKTTVTNVLPPKSADEIALIAKQNELFDIQISELKRQNAALEAIFPEQQQLLRAQTQFAIEAAEFQREQIPIARRAGELQEKLITKTLAELEGTPEEQEIKKLSDARALAILKGEAPSLLPGQQERINTVFTRASEEAQAALRTFGEDIAAARGMTVSDSPIGGELLRQGKELAASLAARKAAAELDVGQTEQQFGEAVRQFQENLRQRAFQNRLALTGVGGRGGGSTFGGEGMTPIFATTTAQAALTGAQGLLNIFSQERLAGGTQITKGSTSQGVDWLRVAAAIAGGLSQAR